MTTTLYGIPNCDQVKKARTWLDDHAIAYVFHDFKKSGVNPDLVQSWLPEVAWDVLLNRKGTTWRALSEQRKAAVTDAVSATALMIESPSIIKRPVLSTAQGTHVGFSEEIYQRLFQK
jgi:arsenate reductase